MNRTPSKNNISNGLEVEKQTEKHQQPNQTKNVFLRGRGRIPAISTRSTTVQRKRTLWLWNNDESEDLMLPLFPEYF